MPSKSANDSPKLTLQAKPQERKSYLTENQLTWAVDLRSEVDGDLPAETKNPEHCRIRSTSHVGRFVGYRTGWQPPQRRPADVRPQPAHPDGKEDHLLYMLLYREKVAQQQAEIERQAQRAQRSQIEKKKNKVNSRSQDSNTPRDSPQQPSSPTPKATAPMVASEGTTDKVAQLPELVSPRREVGGMIRRRPADGPLSGRRERLGTEHGPKDGRAAAHIASVLARPTFGGVVTEHFETKQIGKLFDEWRAANPKEDPTRPSSSSPPNRRSQQAIRGLSNASVLSAGSRTARRLDSPRHRSRPSVTKPAGRISRAEITEEQDIELGGLAPSERRKMERLFRVITDPKKTVETFSDRAVSDHSSRPDPTHIEGFVPLNLCKLYAGPWRLHV